jgi:hypothetical protein
VVLTIRELSARTGGATRDIARLVTAVRDDVTEAVRSASEDRRRAARVELSRRAGDALAQIAIVPRRRAHPEIASGTSEQLRLGRHRQGDAATEALVLEIQRYRDAVDGPRRSAAPSTT